MPVPGTTALFIAGICAVLLGTFVEDRESVAVLLVGFGATSVVLAVALPRLVGSLKVGPSGLEAELLTAVESQAEEAGLSDDEKKEAIDDARTGIEQAWADWMANRLEEAQPRHSGDAASGDAIKRLAVQYVARQQGDG